MDISGVFISHHQILIVRSFSVDIPQVVFCTKDIPCRQHFGQHRMILIVVTMHPVAAKRLQILKRTQEFAENPQMLAIARIVRRVCFGLANHKTLFDFGFVRQAQGL
jgi:hypothetical protein